MSANALLLKPLPIVNVVSGNAATNNPVLNLNNDKPGYTWRSSNLSSVNFIVDLGTVSYDTVALCNTNLRSSDTVRIRTSPATNDGVTGGIDTGTFNAFTGAKDDGVTAITVKQLGSSIAHRYMRIDITSPGNPNGYVEAFRLVVGTALTSDGVAVSAKQSIINQSIIQSGPNYFSATKYPTLAKWDVELPWIDMQTWHDKWWPFLKSVGNDTGFVFVPMMDQPLLWQHTAMFCRIDSGAPASADIDGGCLWTAKLSLVSVTT